MVGVTLSVLPVTLSWITGLVMMLGLVLGVCSCSAMVGVVLAVLPVTLFWLTGVVMMLGGLLLNEPSWGALSSSGGTRPLLLLKTSMVVLSLQSVSAQALQANLSFAAACLGAEVHMQLLLLLGFEVAAVAMHRCELVLSAAELLASKRRTDKGVTCKLTAHGTMQAS
jgi:hypothetical protein